MFRNPDKGTLDDAFSMAAYYVAKHYGVTLRVVWEMGLREFEESFVLATAADKIKAEEMQKATEGAKSKSRVGSTHGPMPFSD